MNWHRDYTRPPWRPLDNRERRAAWEVRWKLQHAAWRNDFGWKWTKQESASTVENRFQSSNSP